MHIEVSSSSASSSSSSSLFSVSLLRFPRKAKGEILKSLALEEGGSIGVGRGDDVIAGAVDWEREREEPNLNRVWHSENRVHCYGIPERENHII